MKITPKTEEEVMRSGLLEKGIYPFEIRKAEEKVSKKGNPMLEVILSVWDKAGKEHAIYDYLMESMEFKLRHFWYCVGLGNVYESGNLNPEILQGKCGTCKVFIKEDKSGQYPPKNAIADYLKEDYLKENVGEKTSQSASEEFVDSDIPF